MAATMPTLTTVGTVHDASVLIDLESAVWTTVDGDERHVSGLVDALVTELATSVWADFIDLHVVGGDPRHARFERVAYHDDLSEAVESPGFGSSMARQLRDYGIPSTFAARMRPESDTWEPTVLIVHDAFDPAAISELVERVEQTPGRGPVVVTTGSHDSADRTIVVDEHEVRVTPPGINVTRTGMTSEDIAAVHDLLDSTELSAVDNEDAAIDLRESPTIPTVRVRENQAPEVMVRVLGPVEVEGGAAPIDRPKSTELVVYLGLHPSGVTDDRLKTALWPDRRVSSGSFHTTTSRARSRLGEARDGTMHFPQLKDGLYKLGEAVGVDAVVFEELVRCSTSTDADETRELLTEAQELVRGAPFAETSRGYQWAYNEGIVGQLESMIADAAEALAEMCFVADDFDRGHWAARQGLLACPGWEPLYRLRMIAFDRQGNPAGVRSVMNELADVLETVEPTTISIPRRWSCGSD